MIKYYIFRTFRMANKVRIMFFFLMAFFPGFWLSIWNKIGLLRGWLFHSVSLFLWAVDNALLAWLHSKTWKKVLKNQSLYFYDWLWLVGLVIILIRIYFCSSLTRNDKLTTFVYKLIDKRMWHFHRNEILLQH